MGHLKRGEALCSIAPENTTRATGRDELAWQIRDTGESVPAVAVIDDVDQFERIFASRITVERRRPLSWRPTFDTLKRTQRSTHAHVSQLGCLTKGV